MQTYKTNHFCFAKLNTGVNYSVILFILTSVILEIFLIPLGLLTSVISLHILTKFYGMFVSYFPYHQNVLPLKTKDRAHFFGGLKQIV